MLHLSVHMVQLAMVFSATLVLASTAAASPLTFQVAIAEGVRYDYLTGLTVPVNDEFTIHASLTMGETHIGDFSTPGQTNVIFRNIFSNGTLQDSPWTESLKSLAVSALAPVDDYGFARRSYLAPDYPYEESIYLEMFETGDQGFTYFHSLQIVRTPQHEGPPGLSPFTPESLQAFLVDATLGGDDFVAIQYSEAGFYRTFDPISQTVTWGPGYRYSAPASITVTAVPEPSSMLLLGISLAGTWVSRRARKTKTIRPGAN